MKKLFTLLSAMMMFCSVAMASPLMDYSAGKGSIDLTWRDTTNSGITSLVYGDANSKSNLDGILTFGLDNNFAFQYRTFDPESKDTPISGMPGITDKTKYSTDEYNLLYKVDRNIAVFTGLAHTKGHVTFSDPTGNFTIKSKNLWQVGVVASTAITDKTTLWTSLAVGGSNLTDWEMGVSYEFAPDLEFNLNYRRFKADNYTGVQSDGTVVNISEAKSRGLGFGVTYKF